MFRVKNMQGLKLNIENMFKQKESKVKIDSSIIIAFAQSRSGTLLNNESIAKDWIKKHPEQHDDFLKLCQAVCSIQNQKISNLKIEEII